MEFDNERECCEEIVEAVFSSTYGKCFRLKLEGKRQTMPANGIKLVLDIHTELYAPTVLYGSSLEGAVVLISDGSPFEYDAFEVPPGT